MKEGMTLENFKSLLGWTSDVIVTVVYEPSIPTEGDSKFKRRKLKGPFVAILKELAWCLEEIKLVGKTEEEIDAIVKDITKDEDLAPLDIFENEYFRHTSHVYFFVKVTLLARQKSVIIINKNFYNGLEEIEAS